MADPVLINIGFIIIRWYSLAYIFGIVIGWWLGKKIIKSVKKEISRKTARIEIVAEELRSSITEMDVLTGRIDVEQVLDNIFLNFCIGK